MINTVFVKTLLQNTSDAIICLASDFSISVFNYNAEEFYQWKNKDIVGKNFLTLCEEAGYEPPLRSDFFNNPHHTESIQDLRNAHGKLCTINWLVFPLSATDNLFEGLVLIGKDIRVKKNTIAYHLDKIVACTPGSLYWKDRHGRYLGCNQFMVQTSGLNSITDIVGKTDGELWPENAENIRENDQYVINSGKTVFLEETVKIPDGATMYFTGVKMPLKDEHDNIIGVIGNSLDITKLKQTEAELIEAKEKAEVANLIKTEFMRNMEHDIRTPFCGVWGIANYLWERETDLQKKEYLGDITLCAKELLDYCNGILDFSKIESGMFPIVDKKFILEDLVHKVVTIELPAAKQKKLQLKKTYDANIPRVLSGDNYRLYRILINLLSNAIKFTEEGAIEVKVSLVKEINKSVLLRFIIEDTGIGIPMEKQEYIFEKFSRLSPSNKGFYKGIGLGLRIVKQFIHEMDGEIDVISKIGSGTQFICTIPFNRPLTDDFVE